METTTTKERPILFSAPLIRAILDGDKDTTRRNVKYKRAGDCPSELPDELVDSEILEWRYQDGQWFGLHEFTTIAVCKCPYGKPGDILWVREAHAFIPQTAGATCNQRVTKTNGPDLTKYQDLACVYRTEAALLGLDGGWKPSIHMPRWASRITLEVVAVRIERLQKVTESDAIAEGVGDLDTFVNLWHKINGPESWKSNPWVWVVKFKRLPQPEDRK